MRYLVRVGSLKQKVDYLEKQLKNIDTQINELKKTKLELKWEGEAANTFNQFFDEYLNELVDMEKKIISYINFLTSYYDRYGTEYSLFRKKLLNSLGMVADYD